jgi:4-amino-4-deoxy-L-arabinose transferase-like glycosyltransferase
MLIWCVLLIGENCSFYYNGHAAVRPPAPGLSIPAARRQTPGIFFCCADEGLFVLIALWLISCALLLAATLLIISLFRPANRVALLLGGYLIAFALVVVTEETAHFFNALHSPGLILAIQAVELGLSLVLWFLFKRPRLSGLSSPVSFTGLLHLLLDAWKRHPLNVLFSAGVGLGYAYSFFLGWMIAPNTYDAITTHAVRVVFWLQHGSLLPWNALRYTQTTYPLNAQLQLLWSAQFLRSDQLFFTIQWLGGLISILCVFGLARLLGYSRAQSWFASLVYACFPLIWMQSSTAQNDLVAAAVFLPVIYFFFLGITRQRTSMLILSGIALGLSLGTKQTLFFYLPGLAVMAALVWWKYRSAVTKYLLHWAAACAAGFALLGSFIYIQNYLSFGNPLAPPEYVDSAVGGTAPTAALGNIAYNSLRLTYQSVDNSGLPEGAGDFFTRAKNRSIGAVLRALNPNLETSRFSAATHSFNFRKPNSLSEDASWFGPVGGLLLFPLALIQIGVSIRKKDPWRAGLGITVFLFLITDAWLRPGWDPYQGRYFIPAAGLLAPFLAALIKPGWLSRLAAGLIAAVSIFILGYTAIFNPGKSPIPRLDDAWSVKANFSRLFELDWIDQVTLQSTGITPMARLVDENVPAQAAIGWYAFTAPEYPVFGEHFSRRIILINPPELLQDREWLTSQQLKYLLVDWGRLQGSAPKDYRELASVFNWLLLVRK